MSGISVDSSWIKNEPPTDPSSLALFKDGYRDILQERRGDLDLGFTLKSFHNVPTYKYHIPRNYNKLKTDVLGSDRVKYTIERLSKGDKMKEALLRKEAELIYMDMAHLLNLKGVRTMAFMAIKVFKALFRRVYVNEEGINRLHHIMQEYPVILMPTHRSYMDFVLVTFVCYHYNLPVPAVAAAMDFKGMKLMGWLLQNCGAFYIRRSFGSDHLYWSIFTEYVQTQLKNGDHPLEFFVEGTRSRTNKSYIPKIGMLAASLESYFKAELPDVLIVPVSLTFDRIVEESLYAFELLGIPKPKESTSGLLKARKILSEDFGSVHIHIGEAISIRQISDGKIDRVSHALEPRYINSLTADEQILITNLAYQIVKQQQHQFIIPPGTLLATVFIQHAGRDLHINELAKKVDWLKRQACNLGAYVDWPGNVSLMNVIHMCLRLHKNLLKLNENGVVQLITIDKYNDDEDEDDKNASSSSQSSSSSPSQPSSSSLLLDASTYLMLASYRNHVTHLFVDVAIVMMGIKSRSKYCWQASLDDLYDDYVFLESLLSKDFVFLPGQSRQTFDKTISQLKNTGVLVYKPKIHQPQHQQQNINTSDINSAAADDTNDSIIIDTTSSPTLSLSPSCTSSSSSSSPHGSDVLLLDRCLMTNHSSFFCNMFQPFMLAYWIVCWSLVNRKEFQMETPQKDLTVKIQKLMLKLLETRCTTHLEILSLDLINNALLSFVQIGAVAKSKRGDNVVLLAKTSELSDLLKKIATYVDVVKVSEAVTSLMMMSSFSQLSPPVIKSKL